MNNLKIELQCSDVILEPTYNKTFDVMVNSEQVVIHSGAVAFFNGMVNFQTGTTLSGITHFFIPNPNEVTVPDGATEKGVFKKYVEEKIKTYLGENKNKLHFISDALSNNFGGEIHCGTKKINKPKNYIEWLKKEE